MLHELACRACTGAMLISSVLLSLSLYAAEWSLRISFVTAVTCHKPSGRMSIWCEGTQTQTPGLPVATALWPHGQFHPTFLNPLLNIFTTVAVSIWFTLCEL